MAGNRTIMILIDALTKTKGFDDAQQQLVDLAMQAKAAGVGLDGTGKSARRMGEEMGGKRGAVADLTRVLLLQLGATSGAGEAAKLAGIGLNFLEGAERGVGLAMAGATAGIAFAIPLLLELAGATDKVGKNSEGTQDSFSGLLDRMENVRSEGGELGATLDALYQKLVSNRYQSQADELKKLSEQFEANRQQIEKLGRAADGLSPILQADEATIRKFYPTVGAARDEIKRLSDENATLAEKSKTLQEAMLDGTSVAGELDSASQALALSQQKQKDSAEAAKRAQDALNQAFAEGATGQVASALRELAPLLEKDSKALHDLEQEGNLGQLSQDLLDLLTAAPGPAEETGVALRNLGFDLADIQGKLEDVVQAGFEAQDMFAQGLISSETLQKVDQMILAEVDHLRQLGVAVESPFTRAQETLLTIQQNLEGALMNAGDQFAETLAAQFVGLKVSWKSFSQQVMKDLIAMVIKALEFRAIMSFLDFFTGGAASAAGAAAGVGGISIGGGVYAAAAGGVVTGGIAGMDSILAFMSPGEMVLPAPLARDFTDFSGMAREARAGRSVSTGPELAMAIQIMPRRDRQQEAAELLNDINELVERKGFRLTATKVMG
jgi:hypothetical protein